MSRCRVLSAANASEKQSRHYQLERLRRVSVYRIVKKSVLILVALAAIPVGALAASFDCGKASNLVEQAICDDPVLSRLDEEMAPLYRRAKSLSVDQHAFLARARESLKERAACKDKACILAWFEKRREELVRASSTGSICKTYDRPLRLSGKLARLSFPGRPNFESIARGDEEEVGFYLILDAPICMRGDDETPDEYSQSGVALVQLVLDETGYRMLRPLLGKRVTLQGQPMAAHTAHHHAPLVLDGVSVVSADVR